ncbi:hypothetical protein DL96DRAFT_1617474 [Flagelloscypha sp. PMI_526]|nr:hypothetical protein DL96DRAFT_1617474 [Flagelloscypha sp. PMI_526]
MLLFSTREDGKSRLILWLANLYWIRLITGRPLSSQQSRGTKIMMLTLGDYESGESSASLVKEFSENQKIE